MGNMPVQQVMGPASIFNALSIILLELDLLVYVLSAFSKGVPSMLHAVLTQHCILEVNP